MTGPEHYLEAERMVLNDGVQPPPTDADIAIAQVHATLALAAATALDARGISSAGEDRAWERACAAPWMPGGVPNV